MSKTMTKSPIEGNLRHWNALGTTDPAHTKPFNRAGGFRGTAVRPIESVRRMTEHFGPCGVGWGMDKPDFQVIPIEGNGELMVFCSVSLWYDDGDPALSRAVVYGVGGDKVVIRGRDGLRTSDEAFKSAYTDALSNAMKHIGVAADVHMGRFDDSKYVADTRATFERDAQPVKAEPSKTSAKALAEPADDGLVARAYDEASRGTFALRAFWGGLTVAEKRALGGRAGCPAPLKAIAEKADKQIEAENPNMQNGIDPAELADSAQQIGV